MIHIQNTRNGLMSKVICVCISTCCLCLCLCPHCVVNVLVLESHPTPHTSNWIRFFFFESYPFSHGVSVCPPVYWQQTTFKLPYTLRYLKVGNSNYIKL